MTSGVDWTERVRARVDVLVLRVRMAVFLLRIAKRLRGEAPLDELVRGVAVRTETAQRRPMNRIFRAADGLLARRPFRHPFFPTKFCLTRSLVLLRFLRQSGYGADLHIGVVFDPTEEGEGRALEGHSWISLDGEVVGEAQPPTDRYREIYAYVGEEGSASCS